MLPASALAENPAEVMELGRIDVVATTPLPGLGTPLSRVPANVQVFGARDFQRQRALALPDLLERGAASTALGTGQGNPFQPDISYRGFIASPLLGTPQGVSVFQDGVRVNESFGDFVNWDLIPQSAIASIQVIPGSNAAFGPNTLGAAVGIHTKSGSQFPGGAFEASGGSSGRGALTIEQGGSRGAWDYFFTAHGLDDRGWALHNPSRLRQLFAKVGHQTETTDLDVSATAADNRLEATQFLPRSFFGDIRQPYTYPDRTTNRLAFLAAKGSRFVTKDVLLEGNVYDRRYRGDSFASNVNDAGSDAAASPATNDRASIDQHARGASVQVTHTAKVAGGDHRLVLGVSADLGNTRFTRSQQPARFDDTRGSVATGAFETTTQVDSRGRQLAAFFTEAIDPSPHWLLTLTGRYNEGRIAITDRTGLDQGLNGTHRISRVSPAIGINFNPTPRLTAYASHAQSLRMPTPVELTCADPDAPCKLPNNFLSDPPLRPIRASTLEWGARGEIAKATKWNVALYRTDLEDDIQFVSSGSGASTRGYFRNVGATRREGLELGAEGHAGSWEWEARYGFVSATFRTPFIERSPDNSAADANGEIAVAAGRRIPGIPRQNFKARVAYAERDRWSVAMTMVAHGSTYARGDENNANANGRIPGLAVVHLDAQRRVFDRSEIFARIDNVLDKRYASSGALGRNLFTGTDGRYDPEGARHETFLGPGAPRAIRVGLRHEWR